MSAFAVVADPRLRPTGTLQLRREHLHRRVPESPNSTNGPPCPYDLAVGLLFHILLTLCLDSLELILASGWSLLGCDWVNHFVVFAWYVVYNLFKDQPLYCLRLVCDWYAQQSVIKVTVRVDGIFRTVQLDNESTIADLLQMFPGRKVMLQSMVLRSSSSLLGKVGVCSGAVLTTSVRLYGGGDNGARGFHDNQREASEARIPSWNGDPGSFHRFETQVEWWLEGEDLDYYTRSGSQTTWACKGES